MSVLPYVYVDTPHDKNYEYAGICVKIGDRIVSRQCSECIKEDAKNTGAFLRTKELEAWIYSSSIDNYPHDLADEKGLDWADYPDYCLRELITEGYVSNGLARLTD